jgi:tetratricopeptide (TPR) repeat protein
MQALAQIDQEIENVRSAWRLASAQGMAVPIGQAAGSLYRYYDMRSRFRQAEAAFGQAVVGLQAAPGQAPSERERVGAVLGTVMVMQGYFASRLYEDEKAYELVRRGLALLRRLGARKELALANILALWAKGPTVMYAEESVESAEAEEMARESLAIYEELGDRSGMAHALFDLGLAASLYRGDHVEAARLVRESVEINRQIGNRWGAGFALFELGAIAQRLGMREESKGYYQESLEMRRHVDDRWGVALCLDCVGYLTRELGQYDEAERLHQESLALHREIGDRLGTAGSLDNLGLVQFNLGDHDQARALFLEALPIRREVGRPWHVAISLLHLGDVALTLGEFEEAEGLYRKSIQQYEGLEPAGMAMPRCRLGDVLRATGDSQGVRREYRMALEIALHLSQTSQTLDTLMSVALLLADSGDADEAARLAALVAEHKASSLQTRQRAERLLAELGTQPPPETTSARQEWARSEELEAVAVRVKTILVMASEPS